MAVTRTFAKGDKVYAITSGTYGARFTQGIVEKVTPSGLIDVRFGDPTKDTAAYTRIERYRSDGSKPGTNGVRNYHESLDLKPFDERTALINRDNRAQEAANAIRAIEGNKEIRGSWGLVSLNTEIARLEAAVAAAKLLVEGIEVSK